VNDPTNNGADTRLRLAALHQAVRQVGDTLTDLSPEQRAQVIEALREGRCPSQPDRECPPEKGEIDTV